MSNDGHVAEVDDQSRGSLFTRLRSYFVVVPVAYLCTGIMGTLSLLSSLFDRDGRMQHWFAHRWAKMMLKIVGVRVRLQGLENLDCSKPAVYAANHLSALDIPILYATLPMQFRILAKKELFIYPFLGWHLKRSGQIAVDQSDARASLRSLNRAGESLREGMPLVVFPEGGRSPSGELQEFMGGAFYSALKAQVPVVPIVITGVRELLPMNSFHALPGEADVVFCHPVRTEGMTARDMDKLATMVRQVMVQELSARTPRTGQPLSSEEVAL